MNKIIVSSILMICAGCQSVKQPPECSNTSSTEVVFITIKKVESSYETEAKLIRIKSLEQDQHADVLASPRVTSKPNNWTTIRVVEVPKDYASNTKIMLDHEMVEIPNGYGSTLKIMVTPKGDNVHAKGIFAVAKNSEHFEIPFDGDFELGTPTTIYERKEYFGPNAHTNVIEKTKPGCENLFNKKDSNQ